jgi:propanol-preferring alcohol dehydrogenase
LPLPFSATHQRHTTPNHHSIDHTRHEILTRQFIETANMAEPQTPIPDHHRAIIYDNPGHNSAAITTIPTPRPSPGEILVKITHSGVCSSDHGLMLNKWTHLPPTPQGQIGGHEGVGTIVAFGPDTAPANLQLGSRVGIKWIASVCGSCIACLAGRDAMCAGQKISGFYTPGTFQEYVVAKADYVTPIPDGVESGMAAPLLCGGVTAYSGLKKSGAQAVGFLPAVMMDGKAGGEY